ncbi:hypothetical protein AAKU55_001101 [Oxalobacteraceae bacterium GrIS 1.11]
MNSVIEIRSYQLKAGMTQQFHRIMQEQSLPLLLAAGTDVLAAKPSLHAPDAYALIRAYPSLTERGHSQDEFYTSGAWLQGPRDALMACIDHYTTVVMDADGAIIDALRHAAP